ncbi:hypothetical protein [Bartonella rattaustraliani]|nr:hypothetical protein [Bartonella rattaustraliani]
MGLSLYNSLKHRRKMGCGVLRDISFKQARECATEGVLFCVKVATPLKT